MGTTQRLVPGVPGQPNWRDLNTAITNIARTVEQEIDVEQNQSTSENSAEEFKKVLEKRQQFTTNAYRSLVKTGGGKKTISSGKSSSIGKAGLKAASRISLFVSGVSSSGLATTLEEIGFGDLKGKSVEDVVDFLLIYCTESNSGMDETAAAKAASEVLNEIASQSGNDLQKFEELLKEYSDGKGLSDLICLFWGLYIFEHLSQRFQEKITQNRGDLVSKQTFQIIKDDIIGQVTLLNDKRPISKIDWHSNDGKKVIEEIFTSIINILCNESDN